MGRSLVRGFVVVTVLTVVACGLDESGETGPRNDAGGKDATVDAPADVGDDVAQDTALPDARPDHAGKDAPSDTAADTSDAKDVSTDEGGCMADTKTDANNCGACGHSCLGGTCMDSACQPVKIANDGHPFAFALQGTTLYWTRADQNTVMSCALPGCASPTNLGGCGYTWGIAVDSANYYFTCHNAAEIYACPLSGSCGAPLPGPPNPTGIAVDATNIYWLSQQGMPPGMHTGLVLSQPIAGGAMTTLRTGQNFPAAIAVQSGTLFWTEAAQGTVAKCTTAAGCDDYAQIVMGLENPDQIVLDATHVYFTSNGTMPGYSDGTVIQTKLDGSAAVTLASSQAYPRGIVVDATYVYWVDFVAMPSTAGTVMRAPIGGGTVVTLATGQKGPIGLTQDATALYWGNFTSGDIMRLAK